MCTGAVRLVPRGTHGGQHSGVLLRHLPHGPGGGFHLPGCRARTRGSSHPRRRQRPHPSGQDRRRGRLQRGLQVDAPAAAQPVRGADRGRGRTESWLTGGATQASVGPRIHAGLLLGESTASWGVAQRCRPTTQRSFQTVLRDRSGLLVAPSDRFSLPGAPEKPSAFPLTANFCCTNSIARSISGGAVAASRQRCSGRPGRHASARCSWSGPRTRAMWTVTRIGSVNLPPG